MVYKGLPYIESVSEVLGRCLQQQGVRTVFKSDKTVRSHFDHSANRDPIMMLAKRDGAVYKISPLQLPLSRRNSNDNEKLLLIANGFSEHNRLEISVLESKCGEHNNDDFSSTVECYESYESAEN